jgi:hypothetical protein
MNTEKCQVSHRSYPKQCEVRGSHGCVGEDSCLEGSQLVSSTGISGDRNAYVFSFKQSNHMLRIEIFDVHDIYIYIFLLLLLL